MVRVLRKVLSVLLACAFLAAGAPSLPAQAATNFTLQVTKTNDGAGTVASRPSGINCGRTCSGVFTEGTSVALTATPARGSIFTGWSGACEGAGRTCTTSITGHSSVIASFEKTNTLSVSKSGRGSGTVTSDISGINCGRTCSAALPSSTSVTLSATPGSGSVFMGWTGACTGTGTCTVSMNAARKITASFLPLYNLTLTLAGLGAGVVTSTSPEMSCSSTCAKSLPSGTVVTLVASPTKGHRFANWSGACSGTTLSCQITMSAARSVTANFVQVPYTLTVSKNGAGTGKVTSSPSGINCTASCSASFLSGSLVTLSAQPSPGSGFTGWSGACNGTDTCTVNVTQAQTVVANFHQVPYTLTIAKSGTGIGHVTSDQVGINCGVDCSDYFAGQVTLTASAGDGSGFIGWSGACTGKSSTCLVEMTASTTATATFEPLRELIVTRIGTGSGTVTSDVGGINCGDSCSAEAVGEVTLTSAAIAGSEFLGWSGACSGGGSTCTVTMSQARTVTASFGRLPTLSVSKSGSGTGTVTSNPTGINCGSTCQGDIARSVTLRAAPARNSAFTGWSGACTGLETTCTVSLSQSEEVTATFELLHRLTVTKTGLGSVSSDPEAVNCGTICLVSVINGTQVTLSATPTPGYAFIGWSGACSGTGTCTLTMNAAASVTANFQQLYQLTVSKTGSGTVTSSGTEIDCGTTCSASLTGTVTLSAVAASGFAFTGWSGACSGTGTCNVTMTSAQTVTANFQQLSYALSVTVSGSGVISVSPTGTLCGPTCSVTRLSGTNVVLTATPSTGFWVSWSGACTGTAATCTVTMSEAKNVTATFALMKTLSIGKSGFGTVQTNPPPIECGSSCGTRFFVGSSVTLAAVPDSGSDFARWSGVCTGLSSTCVFTMPSSNSSVTAYFGLRYPLSVTKTGSGEGTITSSPTGIDCGATCTASLSGNVTLTAIPADGSGFTGWSGWSGACAPTEKQCSVSMSKAQDVTANFSKSAVLSVATEGMGSGTIQQFGGDFSCKTSCEASFSGTITLLAVADAGSAFTGWSGACADDNYNTSCSVLMTEAKSVTARFDPPYGLKIVMGGSGAGSVRGLQNGRWIDAVSCRTTCETSVSGYVSLYASPNGASRFVGFSGGCTSNFPSCGLAMTEDKVVTAVFEPVYTLSVSKSGSGSISSTPAGVNCGVTCAATFAEGVVVSLSATPATDYVFAGWSGACTGKDTCAVTMTSAQSVTATFAPKYPLTVTVSGSGTVTSNPAGINCWSSCQANFAEEVVLTANPYSGYALKNWSGACVTSTTECTVSMTSAKSVTATFVPLYFMDVNLAGAGFGKVTSVPAGIDCGVLCEKHFLSGTSVTLTAIPEPGSKFVGWQGWCYPSVALTCTLPMTLHQLVVATFQPS